MARQFRPVFVLAGLGAALAGLPPAWAADRPAPRGIERPRAASHAHARAPRHRVHPHHRPVFVGGHVPYGVEGPGLVYGLGSFGGRETDIVFNTPDGLTPNGRNYVSLGQYRPVFLDPPVEHRPAFLAPLVPFYP